MGYNYVEATYEKGGKEIKRVYKHLPRCHCLYLLVENRMKDEWQDKYHTEMTLRDRMELGYRGTGANEGAISYRATFTVNKRSK